MKDSAFEGWVEPEHAPTKYPVSVWEECLRVFKNILENREDLFMGKQGQMKRNAYLLQVPCISSEMIIVTT